MSVSLKKWKHFKLTKYQTKKWKQDESLSLYICKSNQRYDIKEIKEKKNKLNLKFMNNEKKGKKFLYHHILEISYKY